MSLLCGRELIKTIARGELIEAIARRKLTKAALLDII